MAQAVADSAAMILCLCSPYNASIHCIKEAISAYEYRLPLLPIKMESGYVPLNVLRFVVSGAPDIELMHENQVEDVADRLTAQLKKYGVMKTAIHKQPSSAPPPQPIDLRKTKPPPSASPHNPLPPITLDSVPLRGHQRSRSETWGAARTCDNQNNNNNSKAIYGPQTSLTSSLLLCGKQ